MPVVLEGPEHVYVDPDAFLDDPYVIYLRKELGADLREIHEDISKIVINKMSAQICGADVKELIRDLASDYDVIVHEPDRIVEINPKGHSKATGIAKVCEILNIPIEHTYAFGDSENDLDMLKFVAHGVAMGNGTERAKEAAEFVTKDVREDGIYYGLLHYGLID